MYDIIIIIEQMLYIIIVITDKSALESRRSGSGHIYRLKPKLNTRNLTY